MNATQLKQQTARSFAYEWHHFDTPPQEWEDNFRGYFQFFSPTFFQEKRVLEAGSGMGRHTYYLSQLAHLVVAIDLGDAIHVTAKNVAGQSNVALAQADIDHLPFPRQSFDFVCSIGVLHHLPDPEAGFRKLVDCLRPGGHIHIYLYWALEEAPAWKRALLAAITAMRRVTVQLPFGLLDKVAWLVALFGYTFFSLPYGLLARWPLTYPLVKNFPLQRYAADGFRVCYNDQFDRLSAPIETRYTRQQVIDLLTRAGLTDLRVEPHFGWIATGRKPEQEQE